MVGRFFLVLFIATSLFTVFRLGRRYFLQKMAQKGLELDQYQIGRPAILYFTTPDCLPCKVIQRPALEQMKQILGEEIIIIEIDALAQPSLADRWGVLSVPTTFIIDTLGRPRRVNHGIAKAEKLIKQLREISSEDPTIDKPVSEPISTFEEACMGMD